MLKRIAMYMKTSLEKGGLQYDAIRVFVALQGDEWIVRIIVTYSLPTPIPTDFLPYVQKWGEKNDLRIIPSRRTTVVEHGFSIPIFSPDYTLSDESFVSTLTDLFAERLTRMRSALHILIPLLHEGLQHLQHLVGGSSDDV